MRELIAPPSDESRGFIDGIKWRGDVSAGQTVEIQFAQSVSQSFLGINMKCASCHDSFIDRWKLSEAYGLAAIYSTRQLEISRCDKPIGEQAVASWLFPEIGQVDAKAAQPERLKQLAALMTHPQNGRTTRTIVNRLWQRMMGRGIVHPVDAMQTEPWSSDLLDYLATYLSENGYDLKRTLAHIATSQAYQSHAQVVKKGADDHGYVYSGPRAKRLTAEQFVDAIWQITGTTPAKAHFQPAAADKSRLQVRAALMKSDMLMRALGRPNREQIVSSRPNDLTTLEAMDLNNANQLSKLLTEGATTLIARHGGNTSVLVDDVYLQALSRVPTGEERQLISTALTETPDAAAIQDFLWSVLLLPEFQLIR